MPESRLLQRISRKGSDQEEIAGKVIKEPKLLPEVFERLSTDKANIKFGCAKILSIISEKKPEILYSKMDFFSDLLDSDNQILKWNAIHILANLTAVDSKNRFEKIFNRYFAPIPGPVMITAANVVKGAGKIARTKPKLIQKIARELLKVEKAKYKTTECRNVALGQTIKSFDQFFDQVKDKKPVIGFVRKQLRNTRGATRRKAEAFVKQYKI